MKRQLLTLITLLLLLPAIGCAAWPTGSISTVNLDADTDSPLLARPALKTTVDQVNAIRDNGEPLLKSTYTAADILTKIKTVDGAGSGLDADSLDGVSFTGFVAAGSYTAADVLTKIKTVDGAGSGLAADTAINSTGTGTVPYLGEVGLRLLRGEVDISGYIISGSEFTVTKGAAGVFTINFTNPFTVNPMVILGSIDYFSSAAWVARTNSYCTINIKNQSGTLIDRGFSFIFIGAK